MQTSRKSFAFTLLGLLFCCGIALLVSVWEGFMIYDFTSIYVWATSQIKISSFFYSICLIFLILELHNYVTIKNKLLLMIGDYSFGIFCIHMLILPLVSKSVYFFIEDSISTYLFIRIMIVMLTVAFSLLIIKVAEYLIGGKYSKLIGLK
jgi:peptidoglycan/LPS O-acetylase OafA/YrhL